MIASLLLFDFIFIYSLCTDTRHFIIIYLGGIVYLYSISCESVSLPFHACVEANTPTPMQDQAMPLTWPAFPLYPSVCVCADAPFVRNLHSTVLDWIRVSTISHPTVLLLD